MAKSVEDIEKAVEQLSPDQFKKFRARYEKFEADNWDKKIGRDSANGKLDQLADAAISDHKAGRSKEL